MIYTFHERIVHFITIRYTVNCFIQDCSPTVQVEKNIKIFIKSFRSFQWLLNIEKQVFLFSFEKLRNLCITVRLFILIFTSIDIQSMCERNKPEIRKQFTVQNIFFYNQCKTIILITIFNKIVFNIRIVQKKCDHSFIMSHQYLKLMWKCYQRYSNLSSALHIREFRAACI